MLNLIMFGAPGSGKGTQATKVAEKYNLISLSTGDILRREINNETELGQQAKPYLDQGGLVPDALVVDILKQEMTKYSETKGFIFDGFPRTIGQAQELKLALEKINEDIATTLVLEVNQEELIKRLLKRGETSERSDDKDQSVIENRLQVYETNTKPLINYYQQQNKLTLVDGLGTIEEIFERLVQAIDKLI